MSDPFRFFVGIDLGSDFHSAHVVDANGKDLAALGVEHGGAGWQKFLEWLNKNTDNAPAGAIAVAAEAPHGAFLDALVERGYALFSINPKQVDRFRDRFSVAGAKDDSRDAFVLAHSLRTDLARFRRLHPDHPRVIRLRELSRAENAVTHDLRAEANRLWALLQRYFPAPLKFCQGADEPWLWDLLKKVDALPGRAAALRPATLQALLAQHRIRRFSAAELQKQLAERLPLVPGVPEALAEQVLLLLPRLRLLSDQRTHLQKQIESMVDELAHDENFSEHRSVEILRSIPGFGRALIAAVLGEAMQPLIDRDYHALRALAGSAPVTIESGKKRLVVMRRACNRRLEQALFHAANVHMQKDPRARQTYARLRHRGASHARALRGVADRLLKLTCVLVRRQELYNPAKRAPVTVLQAA